MKHFYFYLSLLVLTVTLLVVSLNYVLDQVEVVTISQPMVVHTGKGQTVILLEGPRAEINRIIEQPTVSAEALDRASYSVSYSRRVPYTIIVPSS